MKFLQAGHSGRKSFGWRLATVSPALSLILALAPGCAHLKSPSDQDPLAPKQNASSQNGQNGQNAPRSIGEVIKQGASGSGSDRGVAMRDYGEIIINGIKLKNTRFNIPITVNSKVENWVNYFLGKGRPHFERYLERSEYFIPYIRPILVENGMPDDLVYLAMIESGFNNLAKSRAKAVGPWQFMSATGKRYGLMVNWWLDERREIRKSTLAAAQHLRDLYDTFGSWELAASAYNAGEAKIARAIRRFGTKDFWVITRHRFLKPETREYVPKMVAAALIAKNRDQFGFAQPKTQPAADEAVAGDGQVVKLIQSDKSEEKIVRGLDEARDPDDSPQDEDADDSGNETRTESEADAENGQEPEITPATLTIPIPSEPEDPPAIARPIPTPHVSKDGQVGGTDLAEFEVQSPADLLKVARAAGLSYQTVKSLNPELTRWCTPPMVSTYRIKLPAFAKEKFLSTYNHDAYPRKVQFLTYKVRPGDTLQRIARRFGIKVDPIGDLNGVSPRMPLRSGLRVVLPLPNDRSRSFASLDVLDPPEKRRGRRVTRRPGSKYYKINYKKRGSSRLKQALSQPLRKT